MRRPLMKEWFSMLSPLTPLPPSILADFFTDWLFTDVIFHLAWINIPIGSIVQYLDATEDAQVVPTPPGWHRHAYKHVAATQNTEYH